MILTPEEWDEWKQIPTTKEFFKMLKIERERVKELLVLGLYEKDDEARGIAKCLEQLATLDYDSFREVIYGESKRDIPERTTSSYTS
jgi:hypothetical protein